MNKTSRQISGGFGWLMEDWWPKKVMGIVMVRIGDFPQRLITITSNT
jgi:hypothetical protein